MTSTVNFALGSGDSGIPLTAQMKAALVQGSQGGSGTQTFIQNQISINDFYAWLAEMGDQAWNSTTDANGNPAWFAAQKSGSNTISIVVTGSFDPNVINGTTPPTPFDFNGVTYLTVGALTATQFSNEDPLWHITAPLGVATEIPKLFLEHYTTEALGVLLKGLAAGVTSCFQAAQNVTDAAGIEAAAAQGAADAGVDGAEVAESSIVMYAAPAAMIGFVVVAVVPILIEIFAHNTYQSLQVFNMTPFDVTWSIAYQADGELVAAPQTGNGSTSYDYTLPALTATDPSTGVPLMSSATLGFASTSEFSGIGYVLTAAFFEAGTTKQVDTVNVLYDLPFSSANSLVVNATPLVDAQGWYQVNAGQQTNTKTVATVSNSQVAAAATYDYLDGEHPSPSGQNMYWYNSLLVLQPAPA